MKLTNGKEWWMLKKGSKNQNFKGFTDIYPYICFK